jgi:bifunctional DNA-binding transcriptional regulator/antitoxin component of YhaV-PrlF toxin-antitoxin module
MKIMPKTMQLDATVQVRLHGRITLPNDLRQALGIKDGDFVRISVGKVIPEGLKESSNENPHRAVITA